MMVADGTGGMQVELYNSGASHHMCPIHEQFVTYPKIPACPITAVNNCIFYVVGVRDLDVQVLNSALSTKVQLHDALHAPDMGLTVVPIGCIVKASCMVQFKNRICKIVRNSSTIGSIPASTNGLFKVEHLLVAAESPECVDILTLHHRLGHISTDTICHLVVH